MEVSPEYAGKVNIDGAVTNDYPFTQRFTQNVAVEIEALAAPGYEFSHWDGDLKGSENPTVITMTCTKKVMAQFALTTISEVDTNPAYALRNLPDKPVVIGEPFRVVIEAGYFGAFGQVVETLPSGCVYVPDSVAALVGIAEDAIAVSADTNELKFTFLVAPDEKEVMFEYYATASSPSSILFFGKLMGHTATVEPMAGETEIEVIASESTNEDVADDSNSFNPSISWWLVPVVVVVCLIIFFAAKGRA